MFWSATPGGLYARHYAARFPERVAGLVLLDPAHEDYNKYMPEALTAMRSGNRRFALLNAVLGAALSNPITSRLLVLLPPLRRMQDTYRDLFEAETADKGFPEPLRRVLMDRHVSPQWLRVGMLEAKNVEDLYREVRTAGPLPDVPHVVICSMSTDGFRDVVSSGESEELVQAEIDGKRRLYEDFARTVPRGRVVPVDAGHLTIHLRHPDVVAQAISDVLAQAAQQS